MINTLSGGRKELLGANLNDALGTFQCTTATVMGGFAPVVDEVRDEEPRRHGVEELSSAGDTNVAWLRSSENHTLRLQLLRLKYGYNAS